MKWRSPDCFLIPQNVLEELSFQRWSRRRLWSWRRSRRGRLGLSAVCRRQENAKGNHAEEANRYSVTSHISAFCFGLITPRERFGCSRLLFPLPLGEGWVRAYGERKNQTLLPLP